MFDFFSIFGIERLTDLTRRDSFSSISSCGQREQFQTALTNIKTSILTEKEKTPIMDHKPQPSVISCLQKKKQRRKKVIA
uniref:Uncharacterized protein n=1 Tax=Panagrolaimus sp. PS1159 TaxID=55785 RepID=A0AC35FK50_9BILA